jgi:O-antigen ligase
LVLTGFLIPVTTAGVSISTVLIFLFWLMGGRFQEKWERIRRNPIALLCLILYGLMAIGIFYSTASWDEGYHMWIKFRKLLLAPILMTLLETEVWRKRAFFALMGGIVLTLILSYFLALGWWEGGKAYRLYSAAGVPMRDFFVFKGHITQNFFMAFFAYCCWTGALLIEDRRWKIALGVIAAFAVVNVFFLVEGRIGYLILLALLGLTMVRYFAKQLLWAGLAVMLLVGGVFMLSDNFQSRTLAIWDEIEQYQKQDTVTATGLRLEWYRNSMHLIAEHPFFGTGTASVKPEMDKMTVGREGFATTNPHNEYLNLWIQLGFLGTGLFIAMLYWQWRLSASLPPLAEQLARGFVLAFAMGCLLNSFVMDFTEGHFFAYLSAVFFSGISTPINRLPIRQPGP